MSSHMILHIGAGKCGSSSLQSALSAQPLLTSQDGQKFEYVAMDGRRVLRGKKLTERARSSEFCYCDFPPAEHKSGDQSSMLFAASTIQNMVEQEGIVPILSCEGWITEASVFTEERILEQYGGGAKIVMYIRPPVDWLNSAYWQWGAWANVSFDRWFNYSKPMVCWHDYANEWREVPGVSEVSVRLATRDVTSDFLVGCLNVKQNQYIARCNSGTPSHFLRFLQRNREFRPDPHSPQIEFDLADFFSGLRGGAAPWVITPEQQELIFKMLGSNYQKLKPYMDDSDWKVMQDDSRWWSAESYSQRVVEEPGPTCDISAADQLAADLVNYILARPSRKDYDSPKAS